MQEVCGWINAKATKPVWAKMTPNITDIAFPARTALTAGCEGVAAINTITSVMGINLETLRPQPSVEGYSTPGGYSSRAVKPIALAKVTDLIRHHFACKTSFPLRGLACKVQYCILAGSDQHSLHETDRGKSPLVKCMLCSKRPGDTPHR